MEIVYGNKRSVTKMSRVGTVLDSNYIFHISYLFVEGGSGGQYYCSTTGR